MSHVYLVGFMGAGKSTVGRLIAGSLDVPFVDLDEWIEARAGRPVAELFSSEGEAGFRAREHDELVRMESEPPSVVACGGGVILRDENRAFLKRTGTVVYIKVTAAEALARIGDSNTRPLLAGEGGTMATTLLQARETLYRAVADIAVDTVGKTPDRVAEEILSALDAKGSA